MVVLKFGGTSVADAQPIAHAAAIVARQTGPRTVVVSALAGVTDRLTQLARLAESGRREAALGVLARLRGRHADLVDRLSCSNAAELMAFIDSTCEALAGNIEAIADSGQLPVRTLDAILASGEMLSSRIIASAFDRLGVSTDWIDPRLLIVTDASHSAAVPDIERTTRAAERRLRPMLDEGRVPVVGGFVGAACDGSTTTLGRGGSDITAALLGVCLDADEVQIWTDVDGILAADPRVIASPRPVPHLSFEEAHDLARFGAKVLHPATLAVATFSATAVRVLNSRNPDAPGTLVDSAPRPPRARPVAVACTRGLDAVSSAAVNTGLLATPAARDGATAASGSDVALLAVVGEATAANPRIAAEILAALEGTTVHGIAPLESGRTLLLLIDDADVRDAPARVHDLCCGPALDEAAAVDDSIAEVAS
jgi:aspartate kinase